MSEYELLHSNALNFWPDELAQKEKKSSVIPLLIKTQDKFISLLNISDSSPVAWVRTLKSSKSISANLFLKHLIVLSDVGGERLMRYKNELNNFFPKSEMLFSWEGRKYKYIFKTLDDNKTWNNKNLFVDGESLLSSKNLEPIIFDVCMLLLFGGAALSDNLPPELQDKCTIGNLLGKKDELDLFVRQRYIWVSRITGGATANAMGQLAQSYVLEFLRDRLPNWDFSKKSIPGISQNDGRTPIGFDIVAISPQEKYCAIEVSFQVTTNSTVERKAGQAMSRYGQLNKAGHKIAYVIDGAGNFERKSALLTILKYSNCIVTFKPEELEKLVKFLEKI